MYTSIFGAETYILIFGGIYASLSRRSNSLDKTGCQGQNCRFARDVLSPDFLPVCAYVNEKV
jgi:hypothetical protein